MVDYKGILMGEKKTVGFDVNAVQFLENDILATLGQVNHVEVISPMTDYDSDDRDIDAAGVGITDENINYSDMHAYAAPIPSPYVTQTVQNQPIQSTSFEQPDEPEEDDFSDQSEVIQIAKNTASPRKRNKGKFLPKMTGTSEQKKKRQEGRLKASLSRRRTALYKELLHLKISTEWEGLVIIRSKDKKKIVYGGTDEELIDRFLKSNPLVEDIDKKSKTSLKNVDMSKVMGKLAKKQEKINIVPESPVVSPQKLPECVQEMLPKVASISQQQITSLGDIPLDKSDSQHQHQTPVGSFGKKAKVSLFAKGPIDTKKGKASKKRTTKKSNEKNSSLTENYYI